jgi:hypothetical protein
MRKYIAYGIFVVPSDYLIPDYHAKKQHYLETIRNTQTNSKNSMHKYTAANPLSPEDVSIVNSILKGPLNEYYNLYLKNFAFKNPNPEPFFSFGISYNGGHKGLALHKDDSTYTVNFCLLNRATGNEVVFREIVSV